MHSASGDRRVFAAASETAAFGQSAQGCAVSLRGKTAVTAAASRPGRCRADHIRRSLQTGVQ